MLLKNYYNHFASIGLSAAISSASKTTTGTITNCGYYTSSVHSLLGFTLDSMAISTIYAGWGFGTNNAEVTPDDYVLSYITTLKFGSITRTLDSNNRVDISFTLSNTGSSDVTIAEVGYQNSNYTSTGTASSGVCLLYRDVLENPVTIPAGGTGVINVVIDFGFSPF